MTLYTVRHKTTFEYPQPVSTSRHALHLTPRTTAHQTRRMSSLTITPPTTLRSQKLDFFGNSVEFITIETPHDSLEILAESVMELHPLPLPDPATTKPWDAVRDGLTKDLSEEGLHAIECRFTSPYIRPETDLRPYTLESFAAGRPILQGAVDLMRRIYTDFKYESGSTDLGTSVDAVFETRKGVCQDFAHLQIACLRSIGLSARYVSGYLMTHPPEGQPRLTGADASHAWLSVWCPGQGWVDLDPTNNVIPTEEHITVAWGRDYSDVSPIRGVVIGGAGQSHTVEVDVTRITDPVAAGMTSRNGSRG